MSDIVGSNSEKLCHAVVATGCYTKEEEITFDFGSDRGTGKTFRQACGDGEIVVDVERNEMLVVTSGSSLVVAAGNDGINGFTRKVTITSPCPFEFSLSNMQGVSEQATVSYPPDYDVLEGSFTNTNSLYTAAGGDASEKATLTYGAGGVLVLDFSAENFPSAGMQLIDLKVRCKTTCLAIAKQDCPNDKIYWVDAATGVDVDIAKIKPCTVESFSTAASSLSAIAEALTLEDYPVIQWSQAIGYICDQDDERFGDLVCWDFGYSETGEKVYPEGADTPVYLDSKTEESLTPQPALVGKANPLDASESTYKCYTATVTELQTTASEESGTLVWDDAAQGTDLDNAFSFTVSDVGGLSGLNMDFSIDESDGLGSLFTTGSSNGSTNSDNGGAYQFRAGFEGQTDQDSRLRHVMDFSEPVIVDNFFVGDIDRGGDQTQVDITRWQDAARVYGIDSLGNEVAFEQIPGADLVVHSNGFSYMPQDSVEQAGDDDAGNWLTVNSQGVAVVSMIVEYFPGTDAGWNSNETGDANYSIPNSSSRMQLHNLEVTRATEEVVEVESTRSACATLDTDGSEVWRDAITIVKLTEDELATLVDCDQETPNSALIEGCILDAEGSKIAAYTMVNDAGEALFAPRPLTDLGFEGDCC